MLKPASPTPPSRSPWPLRSPSSLGTCDSKARQVCSLFEQKLALIKTVKNEDWLYLVRNLSGPSFRTPASLPPRHGIGMRLFGEVAKGCAGLVWSRTAVDLSDAFIWPSGYFAKTEFNLCDNGRLLNDRANALVSIEDLLEANDSMSCTNAATGVKTKIPQGGLLPHNEVNFRCSGTTGIVAVFARSTEIQHLLFALGVLALLENALGLSLPLVVLDAQSPVHPFDRKAQLGLLQTFLQQEGQAVSRVAVLTPRLPLEAGVYPELSPQQQMTLHGRYGITASSLSRLLNSYSMDSSQSIMLASTGLSTAIKARNAPSAREVARAVASLILDKKGVGVPPAGFVQQLLLEVHNLIDQLGENSTEDMLVPLGMLITIGRFCLGRTKAQLQEASEEVQAWLDVATTSCSGFLLQSWFQTRQEDPDSELWPFLSGRAIENRSTFRDSLGELENANTVSTFVQQLYDLTSSLHKPCLRFRLLRDALGLDSRFSRDAVHGISLLALDIVAPQPWSPFAVDEATQIQSEKRRCRSRSY